MPLVFRSVAGAPRPARSPSWLHVVVLGFVTLASAYMPRAAFANGRFPKAQAIVTAPGDDATIYLRASFGILVSHDTGRSWRWLCEQQLGFSSQWDPPVAASRGGRLWVALTDGARTTLDGCAVADVPALKGELVADLTTDRDGDRVLAVTSPPGKPAFVWRSDDVAKGGVGFTRLGKGVSGFHFDTLEVAPSNPSRAYLTATPEGPGARAHLFRSDDGGATIRELAPALPGDGRLFLASVDPRDPDRLLVRKLSEAGSDVLLSTDGGKTFAVALHMRGAMFGFTRTPDGSAYYAGSGDPKEGLWRSFDRGTTWEPGAKTSVFCLHATATRLLVCSNPYVPAGYAIAESLDRGATVTPLATFDDVGGPVQCDAGTACDEPWPATRAAIATRAHTGDTSYGAGAIDAGGALDASSSSSPPTRAPSASACGCALVGVAPDGRAPLWLFGLALAVAAARARAPRGSRETQRHAEPDHLRVECFIRVRGVVRARSARTAGNQGDS